MAQVTKHLTIGYAADSVDITARDENGDSHRFVLGDVFDEDHEENLVNLIRFLDPTAVVKTTEVY